MVDKWLEFVVDLKFGREHKTKRLFVYSKCSKVSLGEIKWHPAWRHYCFFPTIEFETVHSDRCLLTISEFITRLNAEHDNLKQNNKEANNITN